MIISPLIRASTFQRNLANYATPTSRSFSGESVSRKISQRPTRQEVKRGTMSDEGREGRGEGEGTKKCRRFSATTERRPILISELLPFYFNFLAFKPSKRVYLRNIIAEDRRRLVE